MSASFARVSISDLSVGTFLSSPVFDPSSAGTKLLGKNIRITYQFIERLAARGIESVVVNRRDLAMLKAGTPQGTRRHAEQRDYVRISKSTRATIPIDEQIVAEGFADELKIPITSVEERFGSVSSDRYDHSRMGYSVQRREQQIHRLDESFDDLLKGGGPHEQSLADVCRTSIKSILEDRDMFLCLGLNPFDTDYPTRHSLHVSGIAIAIGMMLGLDETSLSDLGSGCLIHDIGMKQLSRPLHAQRGKLSNDELAELAAHPIFTLDALMRPGVRVSEAARIVAYQVHERCNGSGYPRGRRSGEIHPLAKIAAVADAYVGLVSNRRHRKGLLPYFAIETILHDVAAGCYDAKAVRGLLHAVSMFPIGSFVETNDRQIARVVRANGEAYAQPVIEIWDPRHGQYEPELLNLSRQTSVRIVRAVRGPQVA
ncbi:Cyclic di-GMP phosphodiesterase response regulator RpfG [Rubripirellula lacrimiformis]|uniref:Cyclic di-GMP phosphodiesterase response regulator RpfG n=1 Tax=Rubripirellula lacrimiformis TaxID=1930273 RepID=A0A517N3G2_9BACT|nr:HD domain-containing phosphohydrolase [Rubripirellula lacrimiformis]QDT01674.1 Cyclic di-GMP phosphodiesterase response regulator RpfG [Rubripirellula lacrimiformis]